MKYPKKTHVDKEGKEITWHHPGGKLRRLGPASLNDAELLAVILGSGSSGVEFRVRLRSSFQLQ